MSPLKEPTNKDWEFFVQVIAEIPCLWRIGKACTTALDLISNFFRNPFSSDVYRNLASLVVTIDQIGHECSASNFAIILKSFVQIWNKFPNQSDVKSHLLSTVVEIDQISPAWMRPKDLIILSCLIDQTNYSPLLFAINKLSEGLRFSGTTVFWEIVFETWQPKLW